MSTALGFRLPPALETARPPEERGLARDAVRLMVARYGAPLAHGRMTELPRFLRPGDLLVVNESATIPAALEAVRETASACSCTSRRPIPRPGPTRSAGSPSCAATASGSRTPAPASGSSLPVAPARRCSSPSAASGSGTPRSISTARPLLAYLAAHGAPIRYAHDPRERPLAAYQTIFARVPGSAEMPSAGRPFTPRLLHALAARGVGIARLTLHTGVSSLETGEPPYPERFAIPVETAARVNATRRAGGRVIAVGTTVTRALESAAAADGTVRTAAGWTSLVITPERGVRAVDGLVTGWHEPEASHLLMLEAVAGRPLVERSYAAALALGYRWHEFGDAHLLLR